MIYETITLSEKYPDATLTLYVCDNPPELKMPPRPAVIVCPGGGYRSLSDREAEPIVRKYFGMSMNVYLLRYSLKEKAANFAPLIEAALAIKYVRDHAEEHNTDAEQVYILGFSAGGHLAASSGTLWNHPVVRDAVGVSDGSAPEGINRPNGMILAYPVITMGGSAHSGTRTNVCGSEDPDEETRKQFSLELHVDETTPPVFIWHTVTDQVVNIKNAVLFINALTEAGVLYEAHIYPKGPHGLALCNKETWVEKEDFMAPEAEDWIEKSADWIHRNKKA